MKISELTMKLLDIMDTDGDIEVIACECIGDGLDVPFKIVDCDADFNRVELYVEREY